MPASAWKQLLAGWPWFQGAGRFPIAAYSEFMPPPRLGRKPYGGPDSFLVPERDPRGWRVTEFEEHFELRPGLEKLAHQIVGALACLGRGQPAHGIAKVKLIDNPYWPAELAERASRLHHERFVILMPLALSRTQDDKGRVRWTLFGGSEQGPARGFWRGFFTSPTRELPVEESLGFIRHLLHAVYGEPLDCDLRRAGFRILPQGKELAFAYWQEEPLPAWTKPLLWNGRSPVRGMKYLLTFRPFAQLPDAVQRAYFASDLHLLPFPGSLLFWGPAPYVRLQRQLALAMQVPLLHLIHRHENPWGIRVPQSGILHEPRPGKPEPTNHHGPVRNTYQRTHRWARVHRHEDELAVLAHEDPLAHVLFSTASDDMGLYGKPMARNAELWTHDFDLVLDGPHASRPQIPQAFDTLAAGGIFGYRFLFPAMRVGRHEVYWHRPLVAYLDSKTEQVCVLHDGPLGYLTAYRADQPDPARPIELWPRLLQREPYLAALHQFLHLHDPHPHQTSFNIRKLLDTWHLCGEKPLPRSFARQLLTLPKEETLADWLGSLPQRACNPDQGRKLLEQLCPRIDLPSDDDASSHPKALTFGRTAKRSFEVAYWKTISALAHGQFLNKENADCVRDPITHKLLKHHHRDLEQLGDHLIDYYRRLIARQRMTGKALVGELPFHWETDFDFSLYGGWLNNQRGHTHERNLLVMIPGRDRRRAVIMADHYDTAYMEDHFQEESGGNGAGLAAAGADDNYSASVALMLGAPVFLELSRKGRLDCDVWLIHLTGEEFPADCMGARHLCQWLVEGTLKLHLPDGQRRDLSKTRVQGVYVLDMIAHNIDRDRDVFQIAPGTGQESMWLAYQAHIANEIWNASAPAWNRRSARRQCQRGRRSSDAAKVPAISLHPHLYGEVRPPSDPRSTLFNTDGQIFSDAGVPVVLFMENYDITRKGYHDSYDTMENIDLDYGAAVAAIAIESVARAATERPWNRGSIR